MCPGTGTSSAFLHGCPCMGFQAKARAQQGSRHKILQQGWAPRRCSLHPTLTVTCAGPERKGAGHLCVQLVSSKLLHHCTPDVLALLALNPKQILVRLMQTTTDAVCQGPTRLPQGFSSQNKKMERCSMACLVTPAGSCEAMCRGFAPGPCNMPRPAAACLSRFDCLL